jgi:uncharacterized protein (TIGR00251 family)
MNIEIKVITNAKKRGLIREGIALKVMLTSSPIEGRANEELVGYLSELFSVRKREIKILRGEKTRRKLVSIPVDQETFDSIMKGE